MPCIAQETKWQVRTVQYDLVGMICYHHHIETACLCQSVHDGLFVAVCLSVCAGPSGPDRPRAPGGGGRARRKSGIIMSELGAGLRVPGSNATVSSLLDIAYTQQQQQQALLMRSNSRPTLMYVPLQTNASPFHSTCAQTTAAFRPDNADANPAAA